jgi:hypothetical protein
MLWKATAPRASIKEITPYCRFVSNLALKTAKKVRKRLKRLGISSERVATEDGESFVWAWGKTNRKERKHPR